MLRLDTNKVVGSVNAAGTYKLYSQFSEQMQAAHVPVAPWGPQTHHEVDHWKSAQTMLLLHPFEY